MSAIEKDGSSERDAPGRGSALEVFFAALTLGLTSFGGPIAHLGYFERAYVERRKWLTHEAFAAIVALCQTLPGPASSQVGFLVGLRRAGWGGALAAFIGFTAPSALLMFGFALAAPQLTGPIASGAMHGLRLAAVAVVAQAVVSMAGRLLTGSVTTLLALGAGAFILIVGAPQVQIAALGAGAAIGAVLLRRERPAAEPDLPVRPVAGGAALVLFAALLVGAELVISTGRGRSLPMMAAVFVRAGALVFGGGHVVLPLLRDQLVPPGWLSDDRFLAGYGAAQALPGPLFTFSAYLGAAVAPAGIGMGRRALWAGVALVSLFGPGLLAAVAGLPAAAFVARRPAAAGALAGVNAAVVGVLGAALYDPIWTSAVARPADAAVAAAGFVLLSRWRTPPIIVVAGSVLAAVALQAVR